MIVNDQRAGFTLVELMIVVAIIAIIASIAVPKVMSARLSADENAAIATLRSIATTQQQFQSCSAIDTDADGGGEFGYFGELSGACAMRIHDGATGLPALGTAPDDLLEPPFLPTAFGHIFDDPSGDGVVERQGYYFKMFLPAPLAGGLITARPESDSSTDGGAKAGDMGANWGTANCEIMWSCYAWPVEVGKTGNRAFFINQEGDLISYDNRDNDYTGIANVANIPTFDAALSDVLPGSMDSGLGLTLMGQQANDSNVWTQVGN
jgi:prepilin-type N-terminal cleavage/methylation domain-containing protein